MTVAAPGRAAGSPRSPALWLLRFALAFAGLNALLTFENRWPGFGVHLMPRLSYELCLGLLLLLARVAWRGRLSARAASVASAGFAVLVLARYADVTVPAVFGRPVNVYWDGRHALELARMSAASLTPWQIATLLLAAGAGLAVLLISVRLGIATLARCLLWRRPRPLLLAAVAALSLSFFAYVPERRDTRWFFSLPVTPTLLQQATLLAYVVLPQQAEAALGPSPSFDGTLDGLMGPQGLADVLLLFAESYGAVSVDLPAVATALAPSRAQLAQAVAESGRGVVSARVRSPTFGGASWLAHASLLSGLPINDPSHHDLLLASQRPTLVSHFARHGYRTVGWMPGIKRPWPEGQFYGYERVADDATIGYSGPDFGYWRIPDQAAMGLLHQQELTRATTGPRAPRLVVFPTISTHAPFHPLPPFSPDWDGLAGGSAYSAAQVAAAQAVPLRVKEALPLYIDALRYQFEWLTDYVRRLAPRPLVIVVVGDHQPPALVTGSSSSWDVPVHVISDNPALLQRLQDLGFAAGLDPDAQALGPMQIVTERLLQAFDGAALVGGPKRAQHQHQACTSPEGASTGSARSHARMASAAMPCGCNRRSRSPSETA